MTHASESSVSQALPSSLRGPREDRTQRSRTVFRTHCLTLANERTFVIGSLLDYTATGVDVATCDPLPVDSVVSIDGTIRAGDQWMHLSGMARVKSSEPTDYEVHRVHLALKDARWTNVVDPESNVERVC
jgi:hypothetical protein